MHSLDMDLLNVCLPLSLTTTPCSLIKFGDDIFLESSVSLAPKASSTSSEQLSFESQPIYAGFMISFPGGRIFSRSLDLLCVIAIDRGTPPDGRQSLCILFPDVDDGELGEFFINFGLIGVSGAEFVSFSAKGARRRSSSLEFNSRLFGRTLRLFWEIELYRTLTGAELGFLSTWNLNEIIQLIFNFLFYIEM